MALWPAQAAGLGQGLRLVFVLGQQVGNGRGDVFGDVPGEEVRGEGPVVQHDALFAVGDLGHQAGAVQDHRHRLAGVSAAEQPGVDGHLIEGVGQEGFDVHPGHLFDLRPVQGGGLEDQVDPAPAQLVHPDDGVDHPFDDQRGGLRALLEVGPVRVEAHPFPDFPPRELERPGPDRLHREVPFVFPRPHVGFHLLGAVVGGDDLEGQHGVGAERGQRLGELDLHRARIHGFHALDEGQQVVAPGRIVLLVGIGGEGVLDVFRGQLRAIVPVDLPEQDRVVLLGGRILLDRLRQGQLRVELAALGVHLEVHQAVEDQLVRIEAGDVLGQHRVQGVGKAGNRDHDALGLGFPQQEYAEAGRCRHDREADGDDDGSVFVGH